MLKKCSVLSVGQSNSHESYFLNNIRLESVKSHPYLGIEISSDLKWNRHIDFTVSKADRLLGMLRRVLKTADTKTQQVAYNTLVRPVLEYGCEVGDPYTKKNFDKIEKCKIEH